ncbi:MAG: hypothetical protein ACFB4I_06275 [Cyanophyceae cyanobacterium]
MLNVLKVLQVGSLAALLGSAPVQASTLIRVQDLRTDGADHLEETVFGDDSRFEIYDLEVATVNGETVIRLDSNLPLAGVKDKRAADGHIGYGDLFIETAQGTYAVKFAPNETTLPTGVYKNAVGVNLAADNNGAALGRSNPRPTNLVAGDRIGDVYVSSVPGTEGSGQHRLIIAFAEELLPAGDRQLYFTQECHNDTVELAYQHSPMATEIPTAPMAMPSPGDVPHLGPTLAPSRSALAETPSSENIPSEAFIGAGVVGVAILLALLLGGDSDDADNQLPSFVSSEETEPRATGPDEADSEPLPMPPPTDPSSVPVPVPGLDGGWLAAAGLLFLTFRYLKARR